MTRPADVRRTESEPPGPEEDLRDGRPAEPVELRAGPVTLRFVDGDIRYVRTGATELIRRVYATVRDVNWNTPQAGISGLSVDKGADRFSIQFTAEHRTGQIDYRWQGAIEGGTDGTISFSMDGIALRDFRYCRIGFCLLLPVAEYAGRPYTADTPGGPIRGTLPVGVGPQPYVEGIYWPLLPSFSAFSVTAPDGSRIRASFEGDLFEIEDQRNWGDGSFKAYCTPAALGYPFEARAGQAFHQRVTLSPRVSAAPSDDARTGASLHVGTQVGRLPALGFAMAKAGDDLSSREAALLGRLRPAHLRVDLRLSEASWIGELARARRMAGSLASGLEVALFVTDDADAELRRVAAALVGAPVLRFLVFSESDAAEASTAPRWLRLARQLLSEAAPGARFVAGTNGNFAELNRTRPVAAVADGFCYPVNPQVHLADTDTLVEALASLPATVLTARDFGGDRPVHVTAITLKPPFNQAATEPEGPAGPDELPSSVDPRQVTQFAAAWTVACIRALCEGGAASATFYETTGWRGLMESEQGSPLPDRFPSLPGMVFPVYHVFADLASWTSADVLAMTTSNSLVLDGLALRLGGRTHALVANLTATAQRARVDPLGTGRHVIRTLVPATTGDASGDSPDSREWSRGDGVTRLQEEQGLEVHLGPYEVLTIDAEARL